MTKIKTIALGALACVALIPQSAQAQNYPSRPITIVVPLGAGGALDILTRTYAAKLAERLGQPVVIENKPGGGTVIGANAVAKAEPDGYTLLATASGTLTINATLHKKLPYDPVKDFVPVALYANLAFALVVNPALPVKSVAELIAYARAKNGKLNYASSQVGQVIHLAGEMLKRQGQFDMTAVPGRGGGPSAVNDVVAGNMDLTFADPTLVPSLIAAGKLRALGVTSRQPIASLPGVPPLAEAGLPGFEVVSWHMLLAPAGTPKPIVDRLHAEMKTAMALPDVQKRISDMGLIPVDTPPVADVQKYLATDIAHWGAIIKQAGLAGSE